MDTFISFQPSPYVDGITEDGHELTKLPYPLAYFLDGRIFDETDFWRGRNDRLVGFARDLAVQRVDIYFRELAEEFADNPAAFDKTVGMYLVIENRDGGLGANVNAIASVTVYPAPAPTEPTTQAA